MTRPRRRARRRSVPRHPQHIDDSVEPFDGRDVFPRPRLSGSAPRWGRRRRRVLRQVLLSRLPRRAAQPRECRGRCPAGRSPTCRCGSRRPSPVTPARSSTIVTGCFSSATSMSNWSKARLRNVEYTATTGCRPPSARPAADVTACCSAIPTSNMRSGNRSREFESPVGPGIAAVIATMSSRRSAWAISSSENTDVQSGEDDD